MQTAYISMCPEDTRRLAAELTESLPARACLALHGDLGSGKTCFVKGIATALQIGVPVTSPTFTLINEYTGTQRLTHMDLYRFDRPAELLAVGLDEYLEAPGITVIEWAERAGDLLPPDTIHIHFRVLGDTNAREIIVQRAP